MSVSPNFVSTDLIGTETRVYDTGKYQTRVIEVRQGKLPLIMMHGGGGHAEAYSRNIIPLSDVVDPIAIDFIWHGLSSKPKFSTQPPRSGKHWLNQFTEQVIELLDHLKIKKAVFEGESLGGWICADLAINHPDRVAGIIFNTAWGLTFDPTKVEDKKGDLDSLLQSSLAALKDPSVEAITRRMNWLMPLGGTTDEIVDIRRKIWGRPDTRDSLTEYYKNLFDASTEAALFNEDDIQKIRAPTLVLWSDHNPIQGTDAARRLTELVPGSSLVIIENAGHWPQWEKPTEHNDAVREFIKKLPRQ
jgi:2-hydroxy-6-oxonona-2,4-dienedioate hydrolase